MSNNTGSGFRLDASELIEGISGFENRANAAIRAYAETSALKLQNNARQNARWTDRTGQARQRLTGTCLTAANGYRLELSHGVDYGIWLELANEKRYAIIPETINSTGGEIMSGFNNLLNRLG